MFAEEREVGLAVTEEWCCFPVVDIMAALTAVRKLTAVLVKVASLASARQPNIGKGFLAAGLLLMTRVALHFFVRTFQRVIGLLMIEAIATSRAPINEIKVDSSMFGMTRGAFQEFALRHAAVKPFLGADLWLQFFMAIETEFCRGLFPLLVALEAFIAPFNCCMSARQLTGRDQSKIRQCRTAYKEKRDDASYE